MITLLRHLLSIAIRDVDGHLVAASPDHARLWRDPPNGKSTPTDVQVPLLNGEAQAGRIELVFRPLAEAARWFGLSSSLLMFVGFIGGAGFTGYYLVLHRALRELDPGRAIPERVKTAFDTLAEGVLIMDDEERVLMTNRAFSEKILGKTSPGLHWQQFDGTFPWVPLLDELKPSSEGNVALPDVAAHGDKPFALLYSGLIEVPTDGKYTFSIIASSKVLLRIHRATVLDGDYGYKPGTEVTASILLRTGKHPIRIYYVNRTATAWRQLPKPRHDRGL